MNAQPALVRPLLASEYDAQVALWIIRMSLRLPAIAKQIHAGNSSEDIRQIVGISPLEGKITKADLRPLLVSRESSLEQNLDIKQTALWRNVVMLGELLGLGPVHQQLLLLAALSKRHNLLMDVMDSLRSSSGDSFMRSVAVALGVGSAEVEAALGPQSPLRLARIVKVEWVDMSWGYILATPARLVEALFNEAADINALMAAFLEACPESELAIEDFPHCSEETQLLVSYLAKAIRAKAVGVNVLIYGPPGTGKTEYVRLIASLVSRQSYQVRATDEGGKSISGIERLTLFQLAQSFLRSSESIVLFDEIEDVFPSGEGIIDMFRRQKMEPPGKLFINRLLEENPVPAIWIANEVDHIDRAYLRRFDFSFEMRNPPRSVRMKILQGHFKQHAISDRSIERLATYPALSPAQISKASKIAAITQTAPVETEQTTLLVLRNSMRLLGQEDEQQQGNVSDAHYDVANLNADADLGQLVSQLKARKAIGKSMCGALCFYGPPGTGKTAFAHYLAETLATPILARSASQILGSFVGETEKNMAAMFKQAEIDRSILLLDEADSFLASRAGARASWEVTAVNEMLTQMERLQGLFICSTNLMERLDEASLRRFALKIRFDYLRPEQRWRLFVSHATESNSHTLEKYRHTLNQLNNLTPGDFHTVRRRTDLLGVTLTADELIKRLVKECNGKPGNPKNHIGFIRSSAS